eukprot:CAMPEP_0177745732 /NCGR_PEP_ID=MMETSP0484_2-20121128/30474_1 /TAXON_ID=354590 /ORGANISM="Rhodomonas lens, Strain RHODO" /LENGTH=44 /DNA_ID= /DNA_START= /DNA_END= /DNA_ORIENTATION=
MTIDYEQQWERQGRPSTRMMLSNLASSRSAGAVASQNRWTYASD